MRYRYRISTLYTDTVNITSIKAKTHFAKIHHKDIHRRRFGVRNGWKVLLLNKFITADIYDAYCKDWYVLSLPPRTENCQWQRWTFSLVCPQLMLVNLLDTFEGTKKSRLSSYFCIKTASKYKFWVNDEMRSNKIDSVRDESWFCWVTSPVGCIMFGT